MPKQQSVVNLNPIDAKKRKGLLPSLLITRWSGGKPPKKEEPFGHYLFCGVQGSGKTSSAIWYAERLFKRYTKKGYDMRLFTNIGLGEPVNKQTLYDTVAGFNPELNEIRILIIDEIQIYFQRDAIDKATKHEIDRLTAIFSQLRKRKTFILSTAQVYGRLDKNLREQCLFMVNCKKSITGKLKNEFIPSDDILVDELGRWSGNPKVIYVHGLPKLEYDTKMIISP